MGKRSSAMDAQRSSQKKCSQCGDMFRVKRSHLSRRNYCSKMCQAKAYETRYLGKNNPNHKGILLNSDGYVMALNMKGGRCQLHRAVVSEYIGIDIPVGLFVHHRDCNKINNSIENFALLNGSDHRWLHKQFGNACLWAYLHGKISKEELCSWCDVPEKAHILLDLNVENQVGVIKSGEFRGTPGMGNPEPSPSNDIKVDGKVQRIDGEESPNKPSTSAGHHGNGEDVC